jgi:diguanylate cyclase (GGDEF)-like protein
MKYGKRTLAVLLLCATIVAIFLCVQKEQLPNDVHYGTFNAVSGVWSQNPQKNEASFICTIPQPHEKAEQILFLRSNWKWYRVLVDDRLIYEVSNPQSGAYHFIPLPADGKMLTICFSCDSAAANISVRQSKVAIGEKGAAVFAILKDSGYAVLFFIMAVLLSLLCIVTGVYMRSVKSMDTCRILMTLGLYIFCAGFWVLTDSRILLLVSQKSGVIELLSFLAFFSMPIPMLSFAAQILTGHQKSFTVLKGIFLALLGCYVVQYLCGAMLVFLVLIAAHLLMAATISLTLYFGLQELKQKKCHKLRCFMVGYAIFAIFSVLALASFYVDGILTYSKCYILGMLGFILALAETAWIAACEQIQENANVATYARMAYTDMMTGLGNRAAFQRDSAADASFGGALAYVMMDANNLKVINDSMGHHRGDELLLQIAACLKRALGQKMSGYRLGGDEFAVRLKDVSQLETEAFAEALRREIAAADSQNELTISAAIGYAWTDCNPKDPEVLLHQADNAMYEIKKQMKKQ